MLARRIPYAALAFLTLASCRTATPDKPDDGRQQEAAPPGPAEGRLPRDVTPLRYQLALDVNPDNEDFSGRVDIDVSLSRPRQEIWLHSEGLSVTLARVVVQGEELVARFEETGDGFARVTVPTPVPEGPATLQLAYTGKYDTGLDGLYRTNHQGRWYAFTQMEPLAARKAFPCFDEPGFKTPFDVAVTAPPGVGVFANAPLDVERELDNGRHLSRFATTRPLPTYLFALAAGPLDVVDAPPLSKSAVRDREVKVRGLAARGRGKELAFALQELPKIVALLEDYFGTPYPYAKLDVVAVPDFSAGAMENAGLITFRDGLLLLDEDSAPLKQKQAYVEVMAHELAHQWFGNLVTMEWWDDLWLNEAFATWLAYKVTDRYEPAWGILTTMLVSTHEAMQEDALVSARRIREPIESRGDILNAFDGITYSKGGAVIGMFERFVGEDAFRAGVQSYLAKHADKNATVQDLLYEVSRAAGFDVATPFSTFLDQSGVPQLDIAPVCDDDGARLVVKQSRFLPVGSGGDPARTWQVPLCVRYGTDQWSLESCTLVTEPEQSVPLEAGCPAWLHPNAGGAGYYRWTLPGPALKELARRRDRLTAAERLSFAGAVGAAFAAGTVEVEDALAALEPLASDPEPAVALVPLATYEVIINQLLDDEEGRARARARLAALYLPTNAALGFDAEPGEGPKVKGRRALAVDALVRVAGDGPTQLEAARRARAFLALDGGDMQLDAVAPDLVGSAFLALVRAGDAPTRGRMRTRLYRESNPLLRSHLLRALSGAVAELPAQRARELVLDDRMRKNEWYPPLVAQMRDVRTRAATWDWLKERWTSVVERVPETQRGYLPYAAQGLCSAAAAEDVEAFFAPKLGELMGGERVLAQVVEGIGLCAALSERHGPSASAHFRAQ